MSGQPPHHTRGPLLTAKQRLYLFNSGKLYQALGQMLSRNKEVQKLPSRRKIEDLYWRFLSRPPTAAETRRLMARLEALPKGRERWAFQKDVAWALMNSREFLYRH